MKLRFGRYRGRPLCDVPRDYLLWLLDNVPLRPRMREAIETMVCPDNASCLGPRWWYLQRSREQGKVLVMEDVAISSGF
jgi:hypothetical protein